jgi:dTDP-4-amino-4,6-dideoxygalactose transaminase
MYRVDGHAQIDMADLLRRITPRTRLVYVTHYFGRPAEMRELIAFCRERNIKLLEDCALSLFSDATGQSGDAAIFSFRKSLPACAGGALVLRDAKGVANHVEQKAAVLTNARDMLSLVRNWSQGVFRFRSAFLSGSRCEDARKPRSSLPDLPASYYCPASAVVRGGSRITSGLLKRTDLQEVVLRRRENYAHLRIRLAGTPGLTFLWDEELLPDGMCPLALPLLVDDKWRWCAELNAAGVTVSPWWTGFHRGLDWSEFPEAVALKARLILLPIHQGLTARHLEYAAAIVRSLAAARSTRPNLDECS